MVTTPKPQPPYLRECCWCLKYIPEEDEDQVCPSNSGDRHVLWLFDHGTNLKSELIDKKN